MEYLPAHLETYLQTSLLLGGFSALCFCLWHCGRFLGLFIIGLAEYFPVKGGMSFFNSSSYHIFSGNGVFS